ncbi:hypothetical protein MPTK1_4g19410 [Marchantia polymorpha subsp. ruderalis]|uniref:Uncharacterized protein n=2 Tax=Marchantia polymorpha TaxID=3197 RepID=A0AAF6BBK7_MARPO|nr:hypothetical protein MARPO_0169s0003 [Marchantia polymorpha]BBN09391.1 hypothetical protein Mp_4g19410 [Marchantia polymorpha subsp. ruderalis]|eukprot:PTQ28238.1 hypothetical protein MARPO_0169s0003 [Marchantia polymorpha]
MLLQHMIKDSISFPSVRLEADTLHHILDGAPILSYKPQYVRYSEEPVRVGKAHGLVQREPRRQQAVHREFPTLELAGNIQSGAYAR